MLGWNRVRAACAGAVLVVLATGGARAAGIDINGGSSWGGWDYRGQSNQLGIWGSGSTTRSFDIYTSVFTFADNVITGGTQVRASGAPLGFAPGPFSTGAFANGNRIFGFGVQMNGAASVEGTTRVTFGLAGNDFLAASSVGGTDGRVSLTNWGHAGDFTVWLNHTASPLGPSEIVVLTSDGTQQGGTGASSTLGGGTGSGVSYDFAVRMFRVGSVGGSYQAFFDLTAMQDLYGGGPNFITSGWNAGPAEIGTIGSSFNLSVLHGDGYITDSQRITFGVSDPPPPVPEPAGIAVFLLALLGLAMIAQRRQA
jgi:hypothetical protein